METQWDMTHLFGAHHQLVHGKIWLRAKASVVAQCDSLRLTNISPSFCIFLILKFIITLLMNQLLDWVNPLFVPCFVFFLMHSCCSEKTTILYQMFGRKTSDWEIFQPSSDRCYMWLTAQSCKCCIIFGTLWLIHVGQNTTTTTTPPFAIRSIRCGPPEFFIWGLCDCFSKHVCTFHCQAARESACGQPDWRAGKTRVRWTYKIKCMRFHAVCLPSRFLPGLTKHAEKNHNPHKYHI